MTKYNANQWYEAMERGEVRAGDLVTGDVVNDMMNALPPACMGYECAQLGETYGHADDGRGHWRPLFLTWRLVCRENDFKRGIGALCSAWGDGATWEFCGACFAGEIVNRYGEFEPTRVEAIA